MRIRSGRWWRGARRCRSGGVGGQCFSRRLVQDEHGPKPISLSVRSRGSAPPPAAVQRVPYWPPEPRRAPRSRPRSRTRRTDPRPDQQLDAADEDKPRRERAEGFGEEQDTSRDEPQGDEVVRDAQDLVPLADDQLAVAEPQHEILSARMAWIGRSPGGRRIAGVHHPGRIPTCLRRNRGRRFSLCVHHAARPVTNAFAIGTSSRRSLTNVGLRRVTPTADIPVCRGGVWRWLKLPHTDN